MKAGSLLFLGGPRDGEVASLNTRCEGYSLFSAAYGNVSFLVYNTLPPASIVALYNAAVARLSARTK